MKKSELIRNNQNQDELESKANEEGKLWSERRLHGSNQRPCMRSGDYTVELHARVSNRVWRTFGQRDTRLLGTAVCLRHAWEKYHSSIHGSLTRPCNVTVYHSRKGYLRIDFKSLARFLRDFLHVESKATLGINSHLWRERKRRKNSIFDLGRIGTASRAIQLEY